MRCGGEVWRWGVGMSCGDEVWGWGVGVRCGDEVWIWGVGMRCGNEVWGWGVGMRCGDEVWRWGVGMRCGDEVWRWGVEMRCGDEVWGWGVGMRCGDEVWGWGVGMRCGNEVWGWGVGMRCGDDGEPVRQMHLLKDITLRVTPPSMDATVSASNTIHSPRPDTAHSMQVQVCHILYHTYMYMYTHLPCTRTIAAPLIATNAAAYPRLLHTTVASTRSHPIWHMVP